MFRELLVSSISHVVKQAISKNVIVAPIRKQQDETLAYRNTNIGFGCTLKAKDPG